MKLKDLKANPKNPRKISNEKLETLKKALYEFGDLGGFVYNRKTDQLVGGHQRGRAIPSSAAVTIEKSYSKPTRTGTLAEGYIEWNGERYRYREVSWEESREKAASLAANKNAGDWDLPRLSEWMKEIAEFKIDLDLTMFDIVERSGLLEFKPEDVKAEWSGMPEFKQDDKTAFKTVALHFHDQEAVNKFAKLIGQKITENTRQIWYPQMIIERAADKRYGSKP